MTANKYQRWVEAAELANHLAEVHLRTGCPDRALVMTAVAMRILTYINRVGITV